MDTLPVGTVKPLSDAGLAAIPSAPGAIPSAVAAMPREKLIALVKELKERRNTAILAHNYQEGPIQEVADFIGDSLKLAQYATQVENPTILFCGVHFMAETVAILCPEKRVLMPDPLAGCSLADTVVPHQMKAWKREHPNGVVVCYINTSAAVKAECDFCCTSSNGVQVIQAIPPEKEILFVPDYYLGTYLKARTGRRIQLWNGYCPAHAVIDPAEIDHLREVYPSAEFLMHPECGCLTKQIDLADRILSTDGMIRYVRESHSQSFIIATEKGILYRMKKENPNKTFIPASEHAGCHHMQRNTLEKVLQSLIWDQYEVRVDPEIACRALIPIKRMLEITERALRNGRGQALGESRLAPWMQDTELSEVGAWWGDWVLASATDLR